MEGKMGPEDDETGLYKTRSEQGKTEHKDQGEQQIFVREELMKVRGEPLAYPSDVQFLPHDTKGKQERLIAMRIYQRRGDSQQSDLAIGDDVSFLVRPSLFIL